MITLFIFATVFFTGCVSRQKVQFYQGISDLKNSEIYNDDKIEIKPDDRLSIKVFAPNQEAAIPFNPMITTRGGGVAAGSNQNIEYLVSREGFIQFPVLGDIMVSGFTINELSKLLEDKIKPYLSDPVVMVRIINFNVSFIGAVNGFVNVEDDQINLSQAISRVGGIDFQGRIDNVLVMRESNGERTFRYLDLTNADVVNSPFYYLEQNDIVYVEPTAPARQNRGYLGTIGSYIGLISSVLSLIVIFTR